MELAARHASEQPPVGIELVFTVAEEDGLRGAKALEIDSLRSPFGFVLDHASPIGEVIDRGADLPATDRGLQRR